MARGLVSKGRLEEAIEKFGVAIKLRPDVPKFILAKADLLESQLRFAEAGPLYRDVWRLDPAEERAQTNATLCEKLAREMEIGSKLGRESLSRLMSTMSAEQRSPAEMMLVAKLLGKEKSLLLGYWFERLKDAPLPPDISLDKCLTMGDDGELKLDLNGTQIADLSAFESMPLRELNLTGCRKVIDLRPLAGMPLRTLNLAATEILDLTALQEMKTLAALDLSFTRISDVSALRGLNLNKLDLGRTLVTDLTPLVGMPLEELVLNLTPVADIESLRGMPLERLGLAKTRVVNLESLRGMSLKELVLHGIPAVDFTPLAGAPLEVLELAETSVGDLSFLKGMPLRVLLLHECQYARNHKILADLSALQVLTLHTSAYFNEVGMLRDHPSLRQIQFGAPNRAGTELAAKPCQEFWLEFDAAAQSRKVGLSVRELAAQGKFAEAAKLFKDQAILGFQDWSTLGTLLLASGDHKGYQAICKEMIERFRRRGEGDEAAVRLCLLNPDPGIPYTKLRQAMPQLGLIREDTPYRLAFVLTNGLLDFRGGQFDDAIGLLQKVRAEGETSEVVIAGAVISMAYFRQGQLDLAKTELVGARAAITPFWPNAPPQRGVWHKWLMAELFLKEAEMLLEGTGSQSDK
jgi:tetratricopeptide (TPR) repeat protein